MKLILTAEVEHLGTAGDAVEVKDGYGRNYLPTRRGRQPPPGAPAPGGGGGGATPAGCWVR